MWCFQRFDDDAFNDENADRLSEAVIFHDDPESNSAVTVPIIDDPPDRCGYILRVFESGAMHLHRIRADVQQPMAALDMATFRTLSHRIEGAALDLSAG